MSFLVFYEACLLSQKAYIETGGYKQDVQELPQDPTPNIPISLHLYISVVLFHYYRSAVHKAALLTSALDSSPSRLCSPATN